MNTTYKKSDLVSVTPTTIGGVNNCGHCDVKLKRTDKANAVKFHSKKTVYVHTACQEAFESRLRTY